MLCFKFFRHPNFNAFKELKNAVALVDFWCALTANATCSVWSTTTTSFYTKLNFATCTLYYTHVRNAPSLPVSFPGKRVWRSRVGIQNSFLFLLHYCLHYCLTLYTRLQVKTSRLLLLLLTKHVLLFISSKNTRILFRRGFVSPQNCSSYIVHMAQHTFLGNTNLCHTNNVCGLPLDKCSCFPTHLLLSSVCLHWSFNMQAYTDFQHNKFPKDLRVKILIESKKFLKKFFSLTKINCKYSTGLSLLQAKMTLISSYRILCWSMDTFVWLRKVFDRPQQPMYPPIYYFIDIRIAFRTKLWIDMAWLFHRNKNAIKPRKRS